MLLRSRGESWCEVTSSWLIVWTPPVGQGRPQYGVGQAGWPAGADGIRRPAPHWSHGLEALGAKEVQPVTVQPVCHRTLDDLAQLFGVPSSSEWLLASSGPRRLTHKPLLAGPGHGSVAPGVRAAWLDLRGVKRSVARESPKEQLRRRHTLRGSPRDRACCSQSRREVFLFGRRNEHSAPRSFRTPMLRKGEEPVLLC